MMTMKLPSSFLFLLSLLFVSILSTTLGDDSLTSPNVDALSLIAFKTSVHDPFSHLKSWKDDDDSPCSWNYIQCNPGGRVQELSLDGLGLSGKTGKFLEKLQFLKVLSLSNNNFTGNISPELANIKGLETLNLSHNAFSGNVPTSFSEMSSLKFLDLSQNALSGGLPDDVFGDCLSLQYLSLAGNLLEGDVPSSLSKCTILNHLNLSHNHFTGNPKFSTLKRLKTLDFSSNMLSGAFPVGGISALQDLKELILKANRFSGMIPSDIGLSPHLNKIDISDNLFTGGVPDSVQTLKPLAFLDFSNNLLSGEFPVWVGNLSNLELLELSGNGFEDSLPISIGELKSLRHLGLSHNKLNGTIPESLAGCKSLSVIRLRGNAFSGRIPGRLFELGLDEVDFARNEFSGSIPKVSGKLSESIQVLDLSGNKLSGEIPEEMGLNSKMRYLNLSWNNLQSRMPLELGYFQNLRVLDLRNSSLTGRIPGDICDSGNLEILQLDGNSLTGSLPDEIGNCSSLIMLSLSYNQLTGSIPKSMSNLKKLKILKLEFNQLSGEIPQELSKLENLLAVNISYNRLIGRLPSGNIFQTLDESSLEGNSGLCSPRLRGPCKMDAQKPLVLDPHAFGYQGGGGENGASQRSSTDHHKVLSVTAILAISAAVVIVLGVVLITFLNVSARRRLAFIDNALESMCSSSSRSGSLATGKLILLDSKKSLDTKRSLDIKKSLDTKKSLDIKKSLDMSSVSFESILNKATEVGEGVFGTVYKAPIEEYGGRVMAIKRLVSSKIIQHPEEFDTEVRILAKARHPNLVAPRGYYWTPQLQLLVSEYAPEGSLQARLHSRPPSTPPLSWSARSKIILGTAKGLAHLHHSFRPPIVHYNIKPSNILLDENMNPKISDFGLARLVTKLDKHSLNSRMQSSVGYLAPELACQTLRVNEKCDVFGFGVLILEVITGRRPIEYREGTVLILNENVRNLVEQGNGLECVDPEMGSYSEDEVLPMLKLALVCTSQIPSSRPSMAEVVQILHVINTPVPSRM